MKPGLCAKKKNELFGEHRIKVFQPYDSEIAAEERTKIQQNLVAPGQLELLIQALHTS